MAADCMVIPRCRSSSIKSIVAPTLSLPRTLRIETLEIHFGKLASPTNLVHRRDASSVVQNTFGQSGLTRVDVGTDSNISDLANVRLRIGSHGRKGNEC